MNHSSTPSQTNRVRWALGVLLTAAVVIALGGCGGGSDSSSSPSSSSEPDPSSASSSQKGASSEFISPGGENKYAKFGKEASEEERKAASSTLEENLQARQAGDWETQCATLGKPVAEELAGEAGAPTGLIGQALVKACGEGLSNLAQPLQASAEVRKNTLTGEIAVLRVEGNQAYALYHGSEGQDYAMPMEKEGIGWKVAALVTLEVN